VDNFSFHKLKVVAAFIFFFDQALIQEGRATLIDSEGVAADSLCSPLLLSLPFQLWHVLY